MEKKNNTNKQIKVLSECEISSNGDIKIKIFDTAGEVDINNRIGEECKKK